MAFHPWTRRWTSGLVQGSSSAGNSTFDARNNVPRVGRVLIARGRDASDVALSSTFGPNKLAGFRVWADELRR
jgi:hypothetical protein